MQSNGSMNRVYRLVWNATTGVWQAVCECSKGRGKTKARTSRATNLSCLIASALGVMPLVVLAADLPTGGQVVAGSAAISQAGTTLTVTQTSGKLATDWQSFNIGVGNTVNFVQPSSSAVALNRVLGSDVSVIQGALNANGQVFLVNPNGVLFTPTAQVNVGALVASTLQLSADDFMAGNYRFSGNSTAGVKNEGRIQVGAGGTVALIAARIENTGNMTAPQGNVLMGAGSVVRLDLGGPAKIEVEAGALNSLIEQGGAIRADGGLIYLTAKAAGDLATSAINHTGIAEARTLSTGAQGEIMLMGDMAKGTVNVGGTLDASAPNGGHGGFIETSAATVKIADALKLSTAAAQGRTGSWLIDPTDFTIASGSGPVTGSGVGAATLQGNLATSNVTIATSPTDTGSELGDIHVNSPVSWNTNTLTLSAHNNININAQLDGGAAGKLSLLYGQASANGGTSTYNVNAAVNLAAGPNFSTQLGSAGPVKSYTVITQLGASGSTTGTDLQGINGGLAANYVLGSNIDASATAGWNSGAGFAPLGTFSGVLDGLGHTINSLTINRPGTSYVGLFSRTSAAAEIRHVGFVGGNIRGQSYVGALVGENRGAISFGYGNSTVTGSGQVGGLAGQNYGNVSNSYATGTISGGTYSGGLVGFNMSGATIQSSYSSGSLSGGNRLGGLVGVNDGSVSDSYSTVTVTDIAQQDLFGGLVGQNGGTITRSYAAGVVNVQVPSNNAGSLVGYNGGTISNSYWNASINSGYNGFGAGNASGATGLTTAQLKAASNLVGFSFVSPATWGFAGTNNTGYPVLCAIRRCTGPAIEVYVNPLTGSSVYGSAPVISYSLVDVSGALYSLTNASLSGTALYGSAPTSTSNAGSYSFSYDSGLVLGGADASNYTLLPWTTPTPWTVNKANAVVTANSDTSKVYNGVSQSVTGFSVTGLVNGETASVLTGVTAGATGTNAGSYTSTASGTASNYNLSFVPGTMDIAKAPLSVTANTASKTYDGVAYSGGNGVVYSGFVNGETSSALNGTLAYAGSSQGASNAGSYAITPVGLTSSNYTVSYVDGALTISPAALSAIAASLTGSVAKTYDGNNTATLTAGNYLITGWVGGDSATITKTSGSYDDANAGSSKTVTVSLVNSDYSATGATNLANYTLPSSVSGNVGSITAAPLTVTANTASKTYDGVAYSGGNGVVYSGFVNGETSSALNGTLAYAGSSQGASNAGSYAITPVGLTSSNYTVSYVDGALTISQRPITVTADTQTKVYGNVEPALTYQLSAGSLVNGDSLSGALTRSAGENVGSYTINASALANGNYLITANNGVLTIAPNLVFDAAIGAALGSATGAATGTTGQLASLPTAPALVNGFAPDTQSGVSGTSNGLSFVEVSGVTDPGSGSRNPNGFTTVFVVGGGINMSDDDTKPVISR